ncbi:MAG: TonB-dependent receptor [Acidobacteria bacterium]|nr:TonB-dependent receptor [Acidobacteriota bacterium]
MRAIRRAIVLLSSFPLIHSTLSAQDARGQILGRLTDPTGAVVTGTPVQAINTATNVRTVTRTNDSGDYILPYLNPGSYTVMVTAPGFREFRQTGIQVEVESRLTFNIRLELAQSTESIEVTATTAVIDLSPNSSGAVIDKEMVLELPLKDGSPVRLAMLAPGVVNLTNAGWTRPFDVGEGQSPPVNGVRSGSNAFTLDGAPNMQRNTVAYIPPPGVVEEFKVATAADASTGFATGAAINLSLKSGTNTLHGQAYDFFQNPKLNASKFFANAARLPKPNIRVNRYGANGSGPIYIPRVYDGRNRSFWMYAYEGIRNSDPRGTVTQAVPTAAQRNGDFSQLLAVGPQYQIYDPYSTAPAPGGRFSRLPLAGNIVPASRINPTARKIAGLWSLPNLPGSPDGTGNWTTPGPESDTYYAHIFRVDHNPSEKHRMFLRANKSRRNQIHSRKHQDAVGTNLQIYNESAAFDDVYIFGPRFLMDNRYSLTHFSWNTYSLQRGFDLPGLGFSQHYVDQIRNADPQGYQLPSINVNGYGALATAGGPNIRYDTTHDFASNLTYVQGAHTLRFGGAFRLLRENTHTRRMASGTFTFNGNWTRGPLDSSPAAPMGQTMAAFLYGLPSGGTFPLTDSYSGQSLLNALYLQDDWKVTSRLTINVGLRYELERPITERFNRSVRSFDMEAASPIAAAATAKYAASPIPEIPASAFHVRGGLTFAGVNGQPRGLWDANHGHFLPRIGMAYAIAPKTVIRSSYGVYFSPYMGTSGQESIQSGYSQNTTFSASPDNGQTYVANLTDPFPNGFLRPAGSSGGLSTQLGQAASFFDPKWKAPYVQRWQFNISREFPSSIVAEIGYVGNRGTHSGTDREFNAVPAQYLSTAPIRDQDTINYLSAAVRNPFYPLLPGTSLSGTTTTRSQLLRPFPQFTSVSATTSNGFSWYHSMQARIQKRFSSSFTASMVFTWSKMMEARGYLNDSDLTPEHVISDQDRPRRLVLTGLWRLPFGRGRRWANSAPAVVDRIIGGWQIQGMSEFQSGPALGFGNSILVANLSDVALPSGERSIKKWFNTSAFVTKSNLQLGQNIRRMSSRFSGIRADGLNQWDLSASKLVPIREKVNLQFRAEFVNAFNHPKFSAPNTNPSNQNFGVITAESQWPRTIQIALKLLF